MVIKIVAWIDLSFLKLEMGIKPFFLWASAGEVLGHAGHAMWSQLFTLHPSNIGSETGAELLGRPPPEGRHQDQSFAPHRVLEDGESLRTSEFELQALHTPGHASNHLCYLHSGHRMLFTGDHIINGSTVVIDPPDGDMSQYINSLLRLKSVDIASIAPGHGAVFKNPYEVIDWIVRHRLERESKVLAALESHGGLTSTQLVPFVYADVDKDRYAWAERSLLAHLIKLQRDGRAINTTDLWYTTRHELSDPE
jgi:glyoxylase-like metal-dependent hydrolase (beta-lactamase superfamily II)